MPVYQLLPAPPQVLSSYARGGRTGGPRAELVPLRDLAGGMVAPDVYGPLEALDAEILRRGGDPRITDLFRVAAIQARARGRYDRWVASGKPRPGSPGFDAQTMKAAFVALPGKSGHNGARSVDVDTGSLAFPVPPDRQIDLLWECAAATGWTPIIAKPTEGASESWHIDCRAELAGIYDRLGYESWALSGALLVGQAGAWQSDAATAQALLHRAGFDVGAIDGAPGRKTTLGAAAALGLASQVQGTAALLSPDGLAKLAALPWSAVTRWTAPRG